MYMHIQPESGGHHSNRAAGLNRLGDRPFIFTIGGICKRFMGDLSNLRVIVMPTGEEEQRNSHARSDTAASRKVSF